MKRGWKLLSELAVGTIAVLLAGEVYLASQGYRCHNPHTYNYREIIANVEHDLRPSCSTSSDMKGRRKVVVLGCSFTYGLGVGAQDTYCWQLNQMQSQYDFRNYGISGMGVNTALLALPEVLQKEQPTIVVYAAIANHIWREENISMVLDTDGSERLQHERQKNKESASAPIYYEGNLHNITLFWMPKRWPCETSLRSVSFIRDVCKNLGYVTYVTGASPESMAEYRYRYGLRSCYTACAQQGIPFVVVDLYGFTEDGKMHRPGQYSKLSLKYYVDEPFSSADRTPSIPIIEAEYACDIMDIPDLHTKPAPEDPQGDHPSAKVHRYYAEKILAGLTQLEAEGKLTVPALDSAPGSAPEAMPASVPRTTP